MSVTDVGTICVKTSGREKGLKCIVVDVIDKNFVLITGPKTLSGVKRRRANINHLTPTNEIVKIKKGFSDKKILEVLKESKKENLMKQ